jgi:hypothetical protein
MEFNTKNPEKIGSLIEQQVRKELGATTPLPYEIEGPGAAGEGSAYWRSITGGDALILCYLHFDLPAPRPTQLRIAMNRTMVGCYVGRVQYVTMIERAVGSKVYLDAPRPWFWQKSKFLGDEVACEKLNAHDEFVKQANKFARGKLNLGSTTVRIDRLFGLLPGESGTEFVAAVLVGDYKIGVKEFFKLASMFEEIL